jgi:hypothetical protein
VRFGFIQTEKAAYPVRVLCRTLKGVPLWLLCLVPAGPE